MRAKLSTLDTTHKLPHSLERVNVPFTTVKTLYQFGILFALSTAMLLTMRKSNKLQMSVPSEACGVLIFFYFFKYTEVRTFRVLISCFSIVVQSALSFTIKNENEY